ncbi:MAG: glycosyltransferase family 39 protein [Acidobacteriota bacterium]
MQPSTLAKRAWLLLFLAVIAFYLYGLGHLPFVGPDEPRYAEVAREMYLRSDFITPTLGGHLWFEKPALLYWMIMAGFGLFGVSEWAARLGPAICGLLTVASVFWIGRNVCSRSETFLSGLGVYSALVAASMGGMIAFSRATSFDIVVTMTTTMALACFLRAELETDGNRRRWLLAGFYAFVGASLLAKGLVGIVIPFGVVLVYYVFRRRWPESDTMLSLLWGGPIALAVAAIWYAPVISRNGWLFIDQFFIQHHFARYVSNKYRHPQPVYYYLIVIILLTLPWTAFLFDALLALKKGWWQSERPEDKFRVFTLAWLLLPILFFSFSGSKLPGYILPALPAAALLSGERLQALIRSPVKSRWPLGLTGGMLIILGAAAIFFASRWPEIPVGWVVATMAPAIVAGTFCLFFAQYRTAAVLAIAGAAFFAPVIALNGSLAALADKESSRDLIQTANARGYGSAPIYGLTDIDRSAEFYAAGRVVYGSDGEPVRFDDASAALRTVAQSGQPLLVFVPLEYQDQLIKLKAAGAEVIGDNGRKALVAVRPR